MSLFDKNLLKVLYRSIEMFYYNYRIDTIYYKYFIEIFCYNYCIETIYYKNHLQDIIPVGLRLIVGSVVEHPPSGISDVLFSLLPRNVMNSRQTANMSGERKKTDLTQNIFLKILIEEII